MVMVRLRKVQSWLICVIVCARFCQPGQAGTIIETFGGPFWASTWDTWRNKDTVWLEKMPWRAVGTFTATTTSYARGGFHPPLILFAPAGNPLTAGVVTGAVDPDSGITGDATL